MTWVAEEVMRSASRRYGVRLIVLVVIGSVGASLAAHASDEIVGWPHKGLA